MVTNPCLTSQKHYKAKRREDASVRQMLRTVTQKNETSPQLVGKWLPGETGRTECATLKTSF